YRSSNRRSVLSQAQRLPRTDSAERVDARDQPADCRWAPLQLSWQWGAVLFQHTHLSSRNHVMRELVFELLKAVNRGRAVACCRLVETRGSTPQKAGAVMLVFEDGSQAGT